jgi:uncharacterized membrane protein
MSIASISNSEIPCECDERARPACDAGATLTYDGKNYCVLHLPDKNKERQFAEAIQRKLTNKDFNFYGVWFPEGRWFRRFTFADKPDFYRATFSGKADFLSTKFPKSAHFRHATFVEKADFSGAEFGPDEVNFTHARFYGPADFKRANFEGKANFRYATFKSDLRFSREQEGKEEARGKISSLSLRYAIVERPERVSFHSLELFPHWFVDVDPRMFELTNISWPNEVGGRLKKNDLLDYLDSEVAHLRDVPLPYNSLAIASRRLAINAEENSRYDEASILRYLSMETLRQGTKHHEPGPKTLHSLYYLLSGYGERIGRAFLILLLIWLVFAILYMITGHIKTGDSISIGQAVGRTLNYSLQVLTLQKSEAPKGLFTPFFVTLETLIGPLQIALVALAIRRQFMR